MPVRLYTSAQASAPVLNGATGSLVAVLDAVLVNGYGALVGAGWTKPFAGVSTAVYRNSSTLGTGFYLNVLDNGPGAGSFKEARVSGFETMTAVSTGTGQFPTTAQLATNLFVRKSVSLDAVARPWVIVADETVFYLFVETGDIINPVKTFTHMFGDIFSYKSNDAYRCMIVGRITENSALQTVDTLASINGGGNLLALTNPGNFMARHSNALGGSLGVGKHLDIKHGEVSSSNVSVGGFLNSYFTYPNGIDNGLYMSPIWIHHNGAVRGYLKGLWSPLHSVPLGHGDTFNGTGSLATKSFLSQISANIQGSTSNFFIETSNTWS